MKKLRIWSVTNCYKKSSSCKRTFCSCLIVLYSNSFYSFFRLSLSSLRFRRCRCLLTTTLGVAGARCSAEEGKGSDVPSVQRALGRKALAGASVSAAAMLRRKPPLLLLYGRVTT